MHFFTKNNIAKLEKYLGVKKHTNKHETHLWEKVAGFTPLFSKIPGILCVCVGNSLAMNATHKNSDIDLFIITKRNRIWTTRILLTFLLAVKGERKNKNNHAGKFCLSFFITEDALNFENISIKNDIYLKYWIQTLKPIINKQQIFETFMEENNSSKDVSSLSTKRGNKGGLGNKVGNIFESLLKSIFLPHTKKSFQKLGKPFGVIISDDMLKFHNQDKRKEISQKIID